MIETSLENTTICTNNTGQQHHAATAPEPFFNTYSLFEAHAKANPRKIALAQAGKRDQNGRFQYTLLSFEQMAHEIEALSSGFARAGIGYGTKVLLLDKPDMRLAIIVFALFRVGAIPIVMDPAMGFQRLLACIKNVAPDALIALPIVHFIRLFFRKYFGTVKTQISTGHTPLPGVIRIDSLYKRDAPAPTPVPTRADDIAGLFFTSGSTGIPKGVESLHRHMKAQMEVLPQMLDLQPGDVDLAAFPLTMLVSPSIGRTCVIPNLGSIHPKKVRPDNIVQSIQDFHVTTCFASPIVWERLSLYCMENEIQLPSVRDAVSGGAPIPNALLARFERILPNGRMHTPYGATEVTPMTSIDSKEILSQTAELTSTGSGTCVGRPVAGIDLRIIELKEADIENWSAARLLPEGQIGEIVVKGALVTERYYRMPDQTRAAKIIEYDEAAKVCAIWHRTGDTGYLDELGRLWFCGRVKHIVEVEGQRYFSVQVEEVVNAEPEVWRSALVGVSESGRKQLGVVIEPYEKQRAHMSPERQKQILDRLRTLGFPVAHCWIYPGSFPVDRRHNSKIERDQLASWAQQALLKKLTG
jgi:acyl-CoA synthetase (AMP-forming)/AMP-acid ligase II